jgi:RHS repeat-associated protein
MIFDTSGKLHDDPATTNVVEGVRRHDYLPFGEENVYNAAGGSRTAANGYLLNDGVRQQFVGYERDAETDLDFAQARYYSSRQGRFTSVDPENAGASLTDGQSWHGYAYAGNNPTTYGDPSGTKREVCYIGGDCQTYTDDGFAEAKKILEGLGYTVSKGKIHDENGELVGTYRRISFDDLPDSSNKILFENARFAPALEKFATVGGAVAVAVLAAIVGGSALLGGRGLLLFGDGQVSLGHIANVRTTLGIGRSRAMAQAVFKVEGQSGTMTAASGESTLGSPIGQPFVFNVLKNHGFHAEQKLLETLAVRFPETARGIVRLTIDHPPCASCTGVINQFIARYPNIQVVVKNFPF